MAEHSLIEWTDATWNPITGCSVVSPGCTNCYAMKLAGMRLSHHESRNGLTRETKAGPVWTGEVRLNEQWLDQPLRWKTPRNIFVCAHGDLFAENVPDEWIIRVVAVSIASWILNGHTLQVLTKRAKRMRKMLNDAAFWEDVNIRIAGLVRHHYDPLTIDLYGSNNMPWGLWLGVSAEDQTRADERIPELLETPAAVRFVSAEPLLGRIDFKRIAMPGIRYETGIHYQDVLRAGSWSAAPLFRPAQPDEPQNYFTNHSDTNHLDWVIVGGESGPDARPMHPDWVRTVRDQCVAARVPFFFKQWGEYASVSEVAGAGAHFTFPDGATVRRVGKKIAGRHLDGVEHSAMPQAQEVRL